MSIQALRERRTGLAIEARKLLDETKDKKWTPEDDAKYNQLTGEITDLDKSIERHQKILDLEAEQRLENREPKKGGKRDTEERNDPAVQPGAREGKPDPEGETPPTSGR